MTNINIGGAFPRTPYSFRHFHLGISGRHFRGHHTHLGVPPGPKPGTRSLIHGCETGHLPAFCMLPPSRFLGRCGYGLSSLRQMLLKERHRAFPGLFGGGFVVAGRGIVVKAVRGAGIAVHLVGHVVLF